MKPEVMSGMLSMGASLLTPGVGVGPALQAAAKSAGQTRLLGLQEEAGKAEHALAQRKATSEERRAGAAERRAAAAETAAAGTAAREDAKLGLEGAKHALNVRRLEEFLIPSLKKRGGTGAGGAITPDDVFRAVNEQVMNSLLMDPDIDPEIDPEGAARQQAMRADPVGYALAETRRQLGGVQGGETPAGQPEQPGAEETSQPQAGKGLVPSIAQHFGAHEGPFGTAATALGAPQIKSWLEGIVSPEGVALAREEAQRLGAAQRQGETSFLGAPATQPAAPPAASSVDPETGLPAFESITDDQWRQIISDPDALAEALVVPGWRDKITAKRTQLGL